MSSVAERYCPSCERSFHEGVRCPEDGTELVVIATAGTDPLVGRSLNDRYTIQERLGAGGMGTVYRGLQHSVGRDVAIKVVSAGLVTNPDVIKRFLREAKLSSRLSHPNAVSILDFGQTPDGLFFLVMELLGGRTLDKVLRIEGKFRLPRVVRIGAQICEALEGAHRLAIVHRDLKPANVMLLEGTEGRDLVKVLDFGLAKSLSADTTNTTMTMSGALLGTPAYMSPEAARGDEVDERGDLYSLGCMLYVLASGRLPFQSDSIHELLSMQTNVKPPPLVGVPPPVAAVIMRLLAKDPVDRFRTAAATRHSLEEAALPFISSDLATAVATTLPGRKKSMPPQADVAVNALTLQSLAGRGTVDVAPVEDRATAAIAETLTPAPAPSVATAPAQPAVTGASEPALAAPSVARPRPRPRAIGWALAIGAVAIAAGVLVMVLRSDDESAATPSSTIDDRDPKPSDVKSADGVKPAEVKPADGVDTAGVKPVDTKPADTKPADTTGGGKKPIDTMAGDPKPGDPSRAGATAGTTKAGATKATATKTTTTKAAATKPGDPKPGDPKPAATKPGDPKPGDPKTTPGLPGSDPTKPDPSKPPDPTKPKSTPW